MENLGGEGQLILSSASGDSSFVQPTLVQHGGDYGCVGEWVWASWCRCRQVCVGGVGVVCDFKAKGCRVLCLSRKKVTFSLSSNKHHHNALSQLHCK